MPLLTEAETGSTCVLASEHCRVSLRPHGLKELRAELAQP